jgi:hypothetical protein
VGAEFFGDFDNLLDAAEEAVKYGQLSSIPKLHDTGAPQQS